MLWLVLMSGCAEGVGAQGGPNSSFELEDVNPGSPTFGQLVGPDTFVGQPVLWYFGHAN